MKCLSKPVEVDAIQWTGRNHNEIKEFFGEECSLVFDDEYHRVTFPMIDGFHAAVSVGWWIIHLGKGSFKCMNDADFCANYIKSDTSIIGYDVSGDHMMLNSAGKLEVPVCCRKTYFVKSCKEAVEQFFADYPDTRLLNFAYPVNAEGKHVL